MAVRAVLTKISPFASSKTSSLGFIEGSSLREKRRCFCFFRDAEGGYRFGRNDKRDEVEEMIKGLSLEDARNVNWDKFSRHKRPFEETRTEGTKETERVIQKLMNDEWNKLDLEGHLEDGDDEGNSEDDA
ncbi:hypothetical protein MKW94_026069 [Papaver nudicaule]|uniref:Uncharacterized protein n=1 Tax=Papaver nudicaule TaxID=74823 RepID=A0AA41SEK2_PAPNU|nr:hypothetical protein [Papaver nudicaule]